MTEEEKQEEQIAIESELIQKQEEVEIAIETQLVTLRQAVRDGGIPWIDKLVKRQHAGDSSRFDQMAAEGWQE